MPTAGERRGPTLMSGRVGIPRAKGRARSAAGAAGLSPGWEAVNSLIWTNEQERAQLPQP